MESHERISAPVLRAASSARRAFPLAVGPTIATTRVVSPMRQSLYVPSSAAARSIRELARAHDTIPYRTNGFRKDMVVEFLLTWKSGRDSFRSLFKPPSHLGIGALRHRLQTGQATNSSTRSAEVVEVSRRTAEVGSGGFARCVRRESSESSRSWLLPGGNAGG